MEFSAQNVLASLSILVGGAGSILGLLVAFGVDITPDQHTAIIAVGSLLLLVAGAFLHPSIPIGSTEEKPEDEIAPAATTTRAKEPPSRRTGR